MTTSVNGSGPAAAATNGSSSPTPAARSTREVTAVPRAPLPTRQRRPGLAALGLIVVVGTGAIFGWLYTTAGEKNPVVVMAREVPAGQVIERSDLTTVDVAGAVTAIAGANLASAVGQRAAVGLLPGTLVQRSMLTEGEAIPAGQVKVGVAVKASQLPAEGVTAGDKVAVVRLVGSGQPATESTTATAVAAATVLADSASVYSVRADPTQGGGTLVTVLVTPAQALAIAEASSTGTAALITVPAS